MKRFIALFLIFACLIPYSSAYAEDPAGTGEAEKPAEPTYESEIEVSKDGKTLTATYLLTPETTGTYYLFRVTPDNEEISSLAPFSQANAENGRVSFALEYDVSDHSAVLYGYVLAIKSSDGYTPLTNARYIDNISEFSHNNRPIFKATTVKGLEVQYIADAQLIGVGQTVVHVKLNELISNDPEKSTAFVYGADRYLIDNEALTLLDYRVKTLSDAGINVHINYILTFDANADEALYYPDAKGESDTIFAPNVSSFDNAKTFAAVMHHLAERYSLSDAKYGFCGSYILGYEVNNTYESHNSGKSDLISNAKDYAAYLRFADLAVRSAYSKGKVYASVSNVWNAADSELVGVFGARDFLTEVSKRVYDVNFGIAVNPYPSDLQMTEFWLDEKATETLDTEYLTMKNITVLNEFLSQKEILCNGKIRSVIIPEFGVSGVYGEESEKKQAAAYALAFYNASRLPTLEAFVWHRHVDHNYEIGLNYGLYSSSELTLERKEKKEIYDIFAAVDCFDSESVKIIKALCSRLPVKDYEELIKNTATRTRVILTIPSVSASISSSRFDSSTIFDFSKSLYSFYPTDNTNYIEQKKEGKTQFMRIASLRLSPFEHMGAGINLEDGMSMAGAEYLTVRVRVNASCKNADFVFMVDGNSRNGRATLRFSSTIPTNEWVTLKFPVHSLTRKEISNARVKIWARTDTSNDEQIFIDVQSVQLHYEKDLTPFVMITVIVVLGIGSSAASFIYVAYNKKKKGKRMY
ncbi:MAG: hypothetical protein E7648_03830 [Ruminococcaceae bacterium]|nr:hypothetical protein [Oscillospiraceae bacterium]